MYYTIAVIVKKHPQRDINNLLLINYVFLDRNRMFLVIRQL